ncbi:MAG: hypothetical protein KDE29_20060, partial [Anaerolineales bacterium]|nr:hypothetical protein [Anaerolineales bacterium]
PVSQRFAPARFCAYVANPNTVALNLPISGATMTLSRYTQIGHDEPIFDGQRAHRHLTSNLAMILANAQQRPDLVTQFERWR